MHGFLRKSALLATTAALAFGGAAAPVAASSDHGHHKDWTDKKCKKQQSQWRKSHKHATAKQKQQENKFLQKHGCSERV